MTEIDVPAPAGEEHEALEALEADYHAHARGLVRFATVLVGPDDAADVVASSFLKVLGSPGWLAATDRRRYLQRVVANEAINMARGRSRRQRREHRDHLNRSWGWAAQPGSSESSMEVRRQVAQLSERQRAVVFLTYWEDLPEPEVAETLGISRGSVRRHLARARARLRSALDD